MTTSDDSFLARWARRKQAVSEERADPDEPAPQKPVPGRMITDPPPSPQTASDRATGDQVATLDTRAANDDVATDTSPLDPETSPEKIDWSTFDFDALDYDADYTRFMGRNVPEHVRQRALRKLWVSNPILANIDGLDDYCEDFTDAVWAVGEIKTSYKVGQGFLTDEEAAEWDRLGKPESETEAGAAAAAAAGSAVTIAPESPDQPEIAAFFAASDAYAAALYPAESNHLVDPAYLAADNARFIVARMPVGASFPQAASPTDVTPTQVGAQTPTRSDEVSSPSADAPGIGRAVGCGAIVLAGDGTAEIKRMWVDPAGRGKGVGRAILARLEALAREDGVTALQLETGIHNMEALALYRASGFTERPPFGTYQPDPLSLFMEKGLE